MLAWALPSARPRLSERALSLRVQSATLALARAGGLRVPATVTTGRQSAIMIAIQLQAVHAVSNSE
eukprot:1471513-Rhodomonas_salina.3